MDQDARFKMLFLESGIGISLVDMDRRIIEVNPAFEKMTGYSNAELKGKTFATLMHAEDNARNLELHQQMLEGTRSFYHMERRYVRKDGAMLWTRLTVALFRDSAGQPEFTMGSMEDITEQKMAEAKVAEQERTLVQSSKMSALGEMAGGIAHEIQSPLTIIRFRAESLRNMAREGKVLVDAAPKIIEHTDQIEKTVTRISNIVKSLRAFARKGEQDPCQRVRVKQLLEDTLELCRDKFKYQSIDLTVEAVDPELFIDCRPTQIQQVLVNLLNNAFDAVQPLETRWVRLALQDQGHQVEIWVTDSGTGIPLDMIEKLFGHGGGFTTKPLGKGTGLGLSICRSILETHGGALRVDSAAKNTRFVIRLPKNQARSPGSAVLSSAA